MFVFETMQEPGINPGTASLLVAIKISFILNDHVIRPHYQIQSGSKVNQTHSNRASSDPRQSAQRREWKNRALVQRCSY